MVVHGDERIDEWHWLREKDNPDVIAHLEAENDWTAARLGHLEGLRRDLFQEIRSRIQETDASAPQVEGDWWWYSRDEEGRQYPVLCRRPRTDEDPESPADPDALAGAEQVVLDENAEAVGREFFEVGSTAVSPDGRLLAWTADVEGNEHYQLRFRDIARGADLPDQLTNVYYGLAWAGDSDTIFYTTVDPAERPHRVWRHRLGTDQSDDVLVLEETAERFRLSVSRLRSGEFVQVTSRSKLTSEVLLIPAAAPEEAPRVVAPRREGVEYSVDHSGEYLWIVTNDKAPDFRLVRAPLSAGSADSWEEVIAERDGVRLIGVAAFAGFLALFERSRGCRRLQVLDLSTLELREVEVPEEVSTATAGTNPQFDTHLLRYAYSSLVTPPSVYDVDVRTGRSALVRRQPVLGGYSPEDYATERRWAVAPDGTQIPLSLLWKKDTTLSPDTPCLLYGYGAYETSRDPTFSPLRLPWLDRGGLYAIAHVRGGGEMGRSWYEQGRLEHKTNTFTDFIACAEELTSSGITSPRRLAARGGSAGGLLVGAVVNRRPDLFRAVVAEVPFVDCLTTILDESLPLSVIEWDEWGNPNEPRFYEVMKSYSPYENVTEQAYPRMLVTAGLNDPRVSYWEPVKWVARIRERNTGDEEVLLKIQMGAGHMGPSGRYSYWQEEAFVLAFLLDALGAG